MGFLKWVEMQFFGNIAGRVRMWNRYIKENTKSMNDFFQDFSSLLDKMFWNFKKFHDFSRLFKTAEKDNIFQTFLPT